MNQENEMRDELLKQNGIEAPALLNTPETKKKMWWLNIWLVFLKFLCIAFWVGAIIAHIALLTNMFIFIAKEQSQNVEPIIFAGVIEPFLIIIALYLTLHINSVSKTSLIINTLMMMEKKMDNKL